MNAVSVKIGDKVNFNPFRGICVSGFTKPQQTSVKGRVIEIHEDHHWFAVEYKLGDVKQRTSFNFSDIGVNVNISKS